MAEKQRNSSIELLRILATVMVISVHFSIWYIPMDSFSFSLSDISRVSIGAWGIVSVNCFLIISGWYGIHLKLKSVWKMAEMLFVVFVPFYLASCIMGKDVLSVNRLTESLMVFSSTNYYVQDYMMLMFLSPVLNAFVEKYRGKMLKWVLMFAFLLFWMCCVRTKNDLLFMHAGQTLIHFVLIYLMARTASEYKDVIVRKKASFYFGIYAACTVVIAVMGACRLRWWCYFDNPFILLSSFCLFFGFLKLEIRNRVVNFLAGSVFTAYLVHTTQPALDFLCDWDNQLFADYPYEIYFFMMWAIVIGVVLLSIFYDKLLRGVILAPVSTFLFNKISNIGFMKKNLLE